MPAKFASFAVGVTNGTNLPIHNVTSDGTVRPHVYEYLLSSDDTPADYAAQYQVQRSTTAGAGGTSVTPEPLDPHSQAAGCSSTHGSYSTTNPTITASTELLTISVNQRASYRWVASPGSELVGIATSANGIILESEAASTAFATEASVLFFE